MATEWLKTTPAHYVFFKMSTANKESLLNNFFTENDVYKRNKMTHLVTNYVQSFIVNSRDFCNRSTGLCGHMSIISHI